MPLNTGCHLHTQQQAEETAVDQGESETATGAGELPRRVRLLDNIIFCLLLRSGEFTTHSNLIQYSLWLLFDI